jgi:hypothetical protein
MIRNTKIKNTPFQNLYEVFKLIPIDPVREKDKKIETGDDFKEWLRLMSLYGDAIDGSEQGDRANFPYWDFLGPKDIYELSDSH